MFCLVSIFFHSTFIPVSIIFQISIKKIADVTIGKYGIEQYEQNF